jgi:hypothetical protein
MLTIDANQQIGLAEFCQDSQIGDAGSSLHQRRNLAAEFIKLF